LAVETQARSILGAVASVAQGEGRPVNSLHIVVKRGAQGVMLASMLPSPPAASSAATAAAAATSAPPQISIRFLPAGRLPSALVNTSGAGDSCVGAFAWKLIQLGPSACSGEDLGAVARAVAYGMRAAEMTLCSPHSVSQELSPKALEHRQKIAEREQE
jgi:sugar/nucleoside kinase (ribokinase family)